MPVEDRTADLVRSKIAEEACAIERVYFVKTDRMYNPKKTNPFKYFAGTIPVLVSAPHSVRHWRQKKIKPSDEFTGSLACILNSLTGCHSLAVTKLYGGDPNFDEQCIYKNTVKELCQAHGIKLVLDLHGASREHGFDIDIGTKNGMALLGNTGYAELLKKSLLAYGIKNISENRFSVAPQNTVTNYVSMVLGIPAIQLEISKKYRVPHQNAVDYCRLTGALAGFIKSLDLD